jgi:cobalt-zinc-cadmium resistance protein CzcA
MTKDRLYEAMRQSLTEIPGVSFNFSGPIKDNVEEAVSGVRGQVVLKIFGTDLTVMKQTLEQSLGILSKVPGIVDLELYRDATVPQLQIVLDRKSLARAGITVDAAQTSPNRADGTVATDGDHERPVPVRLVFRRRNAKTRRE